MLRTEPGLAGADTTGLRLWQKYQYGYYVIILHYYNYGPMVDMTLTFYSTNVILNT